MCLPEDLEKGFWQDIYKYEEEKNMPYVLSVERLALEKGIKIGIEQGIEQVELIGIRKSLLDTLEIKFEKIPKQIVEFINKIDNPEFLRSLLRNAIKYDSLDKFEEKMRLLPND